MKTTAHLQPIIEQICRLKSLVNALIGADNDIDKLEILNRDPIVEEFVKGSPHLQTFLAGLTPACDVAIKSILAIGQGPLVFQQMDSFERPFEKLREMLDVLLPAEAFYAHLGGIVGYHLTVLQLITEKQGHKAEEKPLEQYTKPAGLDLSHETPQVYQAIRKGIESLPKMAEIYPVGGAGDRLQLRDEHTGELLPVAQMKFCGITLLEWLIRDLQAREYLYYKMTGKQTVTPIAMMTSHEKKNNERIFSICEAAGWFGRPQESFRFFTQPLVPVISEEGDWCLSAPLKLILKPGGHGVMWKLAKDGGIFSWFEEQGRSKALVRQINNPIAGVDVGLIAFTGVGFQYNKAFGFASCFRVLNAAEGMNVLVERQVDEAYACTITNIEYTDFAQKGIEDVPAEPGSKYSAFPANTNILFADLQAVEQAMAICLVPGTILNMKNDVDCLDVNGQPRQVRAGRLESTMQNIADYIVDTLPYPISAEQQALLKTYVTYNQRHRTISVTKKSYTQGQSILETPDGCFYDVQRNAYELLSGSCAVEMPCMPDSASFMEQGPSFLVFLHPALGPAFDVIAAKIRGGILKQGADMTIDCGEVDIENLNLSGSLIIKADSPMGHCKNGCMEYSEQTGKCSLKNVTIENKGIDWSLQQKWWRSTINREESLTISLQGNGEFHAENITFTGNCHIEVPDGFRIEALAAGNSYNLIKTKLSHPSWCWQYAFATDNRIVLNLIRE